MRIGCGDFHVGDCFDVMAGLPDQSVDMILADLPYGTTQNKWDSVLPLDRLWAEYWRIAKPSAAIVLTAAQPFTSALVVSQLDRFRYDWSWAKTSATGHLNAKRRPMRNHEDVLIFGTSSILYNPQNLETYGKITRRGGNGTNFGKSGTENLQSHTGYPRSRIEFPNDGKDHPTQKPVALFEYLIRTYTNPGDLVLDNTAGSGTTAIAAENADRRWFCIEKDEGYAAKAIERIRKHVVEALLHD